LLLVVLDRDWTFAGIHGCEGRRCWYVVALYRGIRGGVAFEDGGGRIVDDNSLGILRHVAGRVLGSPGADVRELVGTRSVNASLAILSEDDTVGEVIGYRFARRWEQVAFSSSVIINTLKIRRCAVDHDDGLYLNILVVARVGRSPCSCEGVGTGGRVDRFVAVVNRERVAIVPVGGIQLRFRTDVTGFVSYIGATQGAFENRRLVIDD
jgi:hypothetical protein